MIGLGEIHFNIVEWSMNLFHAQFQYIVRCHSISEPFYVAHFRRSRSRLTNIPNLKFTTKNN